MIKTAIAVFICFLIYYLRGCQGQVIQSTITAVICIQPYTTSSKTSSLNRMISTVIGCIWGILFLIMIYQIPSPGIPLLAIYVLMSLGVIIVLYSCVVMKIPDTATLAAIVFLCIVYAYPDIEDPVQMTLGRTFETMIGVIIAYIVNTIHLPKIKHPEKVFFVHLKDLSADRYAKVPPRVLIELNRLYDEGARICLETRWAPAFLISQLNMLRVNMPVIVLNGAALYDIRENAYFELMEIAHENADLLRKRLGELGYFVSIYAVRSNTMLMFREGSISDAEQADYEIMRRTPYRNYMDGMYEEGDKVIALRIIISNADANAAETALREEPEIVQHFRIVRNELSRPEGYTGFYFYRTDTSFEKMEELLIAYLNRESGGSTEPVHINPSRSDYDPEIHGHILLSRIAGQYMTPGFKRSND